MKLQQLILATLLSSVPTLYPVDAATLNNATATLTNAISTFQTARGMGGGDSNRDFGIMQASITNNSATIVYLTILDSAGLKINNTIKLEGKAYTYLPGNAAQVKLVDSNNKDLNATAAVVANKCYAISHLNNKWAIAELPTTQNIRYTNSTNVPLIIKVTTNNITIKEGIDAGQSFTQTINPASALARKLFLEQSNFNTIPYSPIISVEVHPNLSSFTSKINGVASYKIEVGTNKMLTCTQTYTKGNTITNNSGWPMLINLKLQNSSATRKRIRLEDGQKAQFPTNAHYISIIPLIKNQNSGLIPAKQNFTINNVKGELKILAAA